MTNSRRTRFVAWFTAAYGGDTAEARKKFMDATGYTKGRLAQLFDPTQPFGERAAREIALRLGQPEDLFLQDHAGHAATNAAIAPKPEASPSRAIAGDLVELLASALNDLGDAERERAAIALTTLARAPDSQRARDAMHAVLHTAALGAPTRPPTFSEHAADLAKMLDAIPAGPAKLRAHAAASAALSLHQPPPPEDFDATAGPVPSPAPRPGPRPSRSR